MVSDWSPAGHRDCVDARASPGSMMNGLQTLKQWNEAFNYPTGGMVSAFEFVRAIVTAVRALWHTAGGLRIALPAAV